MENQENFGREFGRRLAHGAAWTLGGLMATAIFGPVALPIILVARAAAASAHPTDGGGPIGGELGGGL